MTPKKKKTVAAKGETVATTIQAQPSIVDQTKIAIRNQLLALVSDGISIKTLGILQRFCNASREALIAIERPQDRLRNSGGGIISLPLGGNIGYDTDGDDGTSGGGAAYSAPAETYGANMLRELMAALTKMQAPKPREETAIDLIYALKAAKESGLAEVAEQLQKTIDERYGDKRKKAA